MSVGKKYSLECLRNFLCLTNAACSLLRKWEKLVTMIWIRQLFTYKITHQGLPRRFPRVTGYGISVLWLLGIFEMLLLHPIKWYIEFYLVILYYVNVNIE